MAGLLRRVPSRPSETPGARTPPRSRSTRTTSSETKHLRHPRQRPGPASTAPKRRRSQESTGPQRQTTGRGTGAAAAGRDQAIGNGTSLRASISDTRVCVCAGMRSPEMHVADRAAGEDVATLMSLVRYDIRPDAGGWTIYDRETDRPATVEGYGAPQL